MRSDLLLALRQLTKARGFTLIAAFTLAVGIGCSTAMFSALRALVMHPFDFPDSEEIVHVWSGNGWPLSPMDFKDLHEQNTSFETFGVYRNGTVNVGEENAQPIIAVQGTHEVLASFGVAPARGRLFTAADNLEGAPPVVIIAHDLWQQTYGGDPDLLGNTIRLNGSDHTVIGIMPAEFEFAGPWIRTANVQIWQPYSLEGQDERGSHWLNGVARLKDGVSLGTAHAEIQTIGRQLSELYPDTNTHKKFLVRSLHHEMTNDVDSQLRLLFGAVALVLLVACANVASMLLARSTQRQGEFSVRVALGATRWQLVRLALTESFLLTALGTLGGLAVAKGGIAVLQLIAPASAARKAAMVIDAPVLVFGLGAALLTALLAGLPPAFTAARTSLAGVIRSDARGAVGSRSRHLMLRTLIIAQITVAFVLANGAAIFSASYYRILAENDKLATDKVLTAELNLLGDRYEEDEAQVQFWTRLEERLSVLPGVQHVGLTSKLPLEGGSNTSALLADQVYDPTEQRISVERSSVTPDYFATMGLKLLHGRGLTAADDMGEDGHLGVVVNTAMVEKAWPDQNPIGQIFRANSAEDPWYTATVVGVVESNRQWGPTQPERPEMFTTPPRAWGRNVHINLRSTQPADFLAPQLRQVVKELDAELALGNIRTFDQVVADGTTGERAMAGLVNFFMAAALGLVAVGLYGTLSYHIAQRTREIGVRMAVGALPGDIHKLVFRQGLIWVALGILLGIGGTFALGSVLSSIVYGMEGITATPLLLAALAVLAAATLALWLPARRAARLDPLKALHTD